MLLDTTNVLILSCLPVMLGASAVFSGSETALFGMTETDRLQLRRRSSIAARSAVTLLNDRRMLLITLMLGNMTVNSLYFVSSSVLMLRSEMDIAGQGLLALGLLLCMILVGEVMPKMIATSRRVGFAMTTAVPLLAMDRLIAPIRITVDRMVVGPLSRLTAPRDAPPELTEAELLALLDVSGSEGVIDDEEQRILGDVFALGNLRVSDVMTPRVRMRAVPTDASRDDVLEVTRETRLTRIPVYDGDLDHIMGFLHTKRYLMHGPDNAPPLAAATTDPTFVPEVATCLDLLAELRRQRVQSAIVVDEFGGTAGVVALRDVVERLVGEIIGEGESGAEPPRLIGLGRWQVGGDESVADWADAFGQKLVSPQAATLGGLIMHRLGRVPVEHDTVDLGNVHLQVERMDGSRVVSVIVTLSHDEPQEPDA